MLNNNSIYFLLFKDAEEFANKHSQKFNVSFVNKSTTTSSSSPASIANNMQRSASVDKIKQQKKNVSFTETPNQSANLSSSNDEEESSAEKNSKSILKNNNKTRSPYCSASSLNSEDPITSRSSIGLKIGSHNDSAYSSSSSNDYLRASNPDLTLANKNRSDTDFLITANSSKKAKLEGYEILVIITNKLSLK